MKTCKDCGETKELVEFYVYSRMADGRRNDCIKCRSAYERNRKKDKEAMMAAHRRWRERHPDRRREFTKRYRALNPEKRKAHETVNNAIRSGKLQHRPCRVCGNSKAHAHHPDYSKPLDVDWLCSQHHVDEHRTERSEQKV